MLRQKLSSWVVQAILLAGAVAAASLAALLLNWQSFNGFAKVAEAAPSNLQVTSYDLNTNSIAISWTDTATYSAPLPCGGQPGWYLNGGRVVSSQSSRSGTVTNRDLGDGGTKTLSLVYIYYSYRDDDNDRRVCSAITGSAATASYDFPARTSISNTSSYDATRNTLTLDWVGGDAEYWKYVINTSGTTDFTAGSLTGALASGASTRTGTVSNIELPRGNSFNVFVIGVSAEDMSPLDVSPTNLLRSSAFSLSVPAVAACASTDLVDLGSLVSYDHSVVGDFTNPSCSVDGTEGGTVDSKFGDVTSTEALVYKFTLSRGRNDVDFAFTPVTAFTTEGQYRMRVRSGTLDGDLLGTVTGTDRLYITNLLLGANQTYIVELMRWGMGGGTEVSLTISYAFIPEPTPTPIPTPTPLPRINIDVRIEPDPRNHLYEENRVYDFTVAGRPETFPVFVRVGNPDAVKISTTSVLDCTLTNNQVNGITRGGAFYLHICGVGTNSTIEVIQESDSALLVRTSIHIPGNPLATPAPVQTSVAIADQSPDGGPQGGGQRDVLGLLVFINAVCQAVGAGCAAELLVNGLVVLAAASLAITPTLVSGGRVSTGSIGLGAAFFVLGLMLGWLLEGLPLWLAAAGLLLLVGLAGAGAVVKLGRAAR